MDAIEFIRKQVETMSALKRAIESTPVLENRDAAIAAITESMKVLESHIVRQVNVPDLLPALKEHGFELDVKDYSIQKMTSGRPVIFLEKGLLATKVVIFWRQKQGPSSIEIGLHDGHWYVASETGDIPEEDKGLPAIVIAALEGLK